MFGQMLFEHTLDRFGNHILEEEQSWKRKKYIYILTLMVISQCKDMEIQLGLQNNHTKLVKKANFCLINL